ncbi:MAG: HEPN domain-containing protein [Deltaproteobacteria bacterium]|nr:HEPN domain-containing protein [Deltaproteobacteria bacterium]
MMESLFSNSHYGWSLFVGHLVLEKLLKACYVRNVDIASPRIHNLLKIAKDAGLELTKEQMLFLDEVTTYNLRTRYPDFKDRFFQMATKEYTEDSIKKIKEFRQWLLQQISR